ncbi:MAG: glycosyltransferase family 2 protein [Clostridia bacterium]|nr:glycosyltransferase family 2 protein [Clostridia bacterium]
MKGQYKVSVIIATYRRKDELADAIRSIGAQTYDNVEIIVVDDNADTEWNGYVGGVIGEVSKSIPFEIKRIVNEHNRGSAKTRNTGILASTGQYIAFLDDDDVFLPERIEKQLDDMIAADADYGITDLDLYNGEGKLIDRRTREYIVNGDPDSLLLYHLKYHMTGTDTLMFRKDYLTGIGGFPPHKDVGDEYYLMLRAINGGGKICYSPHCYVKAIVHEGEYAGLSSGNKKIEGENALYNEKKKYFKKFSLADRRYIRARHNAVIAFAYLRMKKRLMFFIYGVKALFISPISCCKIITNRRG